MKIALVCPASLPATQFGGILFLCVHNARELANIGHDVTIYTTDLDFANNPKTFNKKLPRLETYDQFKINRSHVWFSFYLFYVNPGMYHQILKDRPDIIHTVGIRSFQSFIAALAAKKANIPLVVSDQSGFMVHPDLKKGRLAKKILYKLQSPIIKFIIKQSTRIILANEYEKEIFAKFHVDSKIVIVRNGINLDELKSINSNFKEKYSIKDRFILFVGRFNMVKGIDILLNALALIKDRPEIVNTKLVIMGVDFGFEAEMLKIIDKLKIQDKIIIIKNPPREDIIAAYQACEFLVLPSRWELSPLTPLEGFAFKKAVISTKTSGVLYTIKDGEHGILVEAENHYQLSQAILKLLNDNKMKTECGLAGYKMVQDICNSKAMAVNTLRIYEEVVSR